MDSKYMNATFLNTYLRIQNFKYLITWTFNSFKQYLAFDHNSQNLHEKLPIQLAPSQGFHYDTGSKIENEFL